jgi:hypothetical protein
MRTVKDWWDNFDKLVIPAGAGAVQRTEMRRAFYAGFFSCLEGSGEIVDACGDDENLGAAMMGNLHDECIAFAIREAKK